MTEPARPRRDEDDPLAGVPVVYRERARTFRPVTWTVLILLLGVLIDGFLGGVHSVVVHLPGWALALAVLAGVHVLFVHAANVTKSLVVTDSELVVGDEAVARRTITGGSVGRAPGDLPTLGWTNGFPRWVGAVTIRLDDGRDVLVPTRHPDRLAQALQIVEPEPEDPAALLAVRPATPDEFGDAADVIERADAVFRVAGYVLPARPVDDAELEAAAAVLVVGSPVVGVVQLGIVDDACHVEALAVLPSAMRAGRGTALLDAAWDWAAGSGLPRVTAFAFADVPWSAPWLMRRGFTEVAVPGGELAARLADDPRAAAVGPRLVVSRPVG